MRFQLFRCLSQPVPPTGVHFRLGSTTGARRISQRKQAIIRNHCFAVAAYSIVAVFQLFLKFHFETRIPLKTKGLPLV
jgi:hypothetical protein